MIPRPSSRLIFSIALLAVIFAIGTLWYDLVEGFGALDALYQAVTTLSTVGFDEVKPLDTSGRIFTIVFILTGIGVMFYVAGSIVEELVVGGLAEALGGRRMSRKAHRMREHFIVCGFGRVGREVTRIAIERGEPVIVVDQDPQRVEAAREMGAVAIVGDASAESTLREAHVERARALIAAADADAVNTYILLTARALVPELYMVARAGSEDAERRMRTAGANRVVSPYQIAGRRMAIAALQPMIVDFIDTLTTRSASRGHLLAELVVADEGAALSGHTIAEAFHHAESRTRVLAIERPGADLIVAPEGTETLRPGDRLMIFGAEEDLEALSADGLNRR